MTQKNGVDSLTGLGSLSCKMQTWQEECDVHFASRKLQPWLANYMEFERRRAPGPVIMVI